MKTIRLLPCSGSVSRLLALAILAAIGLTMGVPVQAVPSVNMIIPNVGPTIGGTTLTVMGSGFSSNGTVTLGGATCPIITWSNTNIMCTSAPGQGIGVPLIVTADGQSSSAFTGFNYATPVVDTLTPGAGVTHGGTTNVITGVNFGTNATITLGGTTSLVVSCSHTQAVFLAAPGQGTNVTLIVSVSGQNSAPQKEFSYAPPMVGSLSPAIDSTRGGTTNVITGLNFGTNATVTLGGAICSVISCIHTQIVFIVTPGQGAGVPLVVRAGGQTGLPYWINYPAPTINSSYPDRVPTIGGTTNTILGANFGTNATVTFGGAPCPVISCAHTQIVCLAAPGQGAHISLVVMVSGQSSPTFTDVNYMAPVIDGLTPGTGATIGGTTNTILGSNFGTNATVTLGGNVCSVISCAHTQIVCRAAAGQGTNVPLVVTVSGQATPPDTNFFYAPPEIMFVNPPIHTTQGGTTNEIYGANFGTNATVTLGSNACLVINRSHTQLVFITAPGQGVGVPLVVAVDGRAGFPYWVNYPPPFVDGISPGTSPTLGGATNVVTGSEFGTNATVTLGGAVCPVISCAHTQIVCLATPGQGIGVPLVVTVSEQASQTLGIFTYDPPSILSVSAVAGPDSGGTPITLGGESFGTNGTVTLAGVACPLESWSHTSIQCRTPASGITNAPLVVTVSGEIAVAPADFSYYMTVILACSNSGPGLVFSWPTNAADWLLEQADVLRSNPSPWNLQSVALITNGDHINFTVPLTNSSSFYRLRAP